MTVTVAATVGRYFVVFKARVGRFLAKIVLMASIESVVRFKNAPLLTQQVNNTGE